MARYMLSNVIKVFVYTTLLICCSSGHNILILVGPLRSRLLYCGQLGLALREHGHNVTMVMNSAMKLTDDLIQGGITFETYYSNGEIICEGKEFVQAMLEQEKHRAMRLVMGETGHVLTDKKLFNRLKKQKFDHCIVDSGMIDYFLLCKKLHVPYSTIGSECLITASRMPYLPSYVPHYYVPFSDKMNFVERTLNTLVYLIIPIFEMTYPMFVWHKYNITLRQEFYSKEVTVPNFYELNRDSVLCFRLKDLTIDTVRSSSPNVLSVGGIVVKPVQPLPQDIADFMNSATNGAIVVAFGSWIDPIPDSLTEKFISVFKKLPYNIIWKSNIDNKELPSNIKTSKWIPQNDILAHPNTKLFISHCGGSSAMETIHHGVPVIALPIVLDQIYNAWELEHKHLAIRLDWKTFTEHDLKSAIDEIMMKGDYQATSQTASEISKALPDPKQTAVFWLDHVIKYGDKHLRSSAYDLNYYQMMLVDVYVFLVFVFVMIVFLSCRCTCWCCNKLRRKCMKRKQD